MLVRYIVESYLGVEDSPKFALWAWGPDYLTIINHQRVEYWNAFHGDALHLRGEGFIDEDIPKMIELWKLEVSSEL